MENELLNYIHKNEHKQEHTSKLYKLLNDNRATSENVNALDIITYTLAGITVLGGFSIFMYGMCYNEPTLMIGGGLIAISPLIILSSPTY